MAEISMTFRSGGETNQPQDIYFQAQAFYLAATRAAQTVVTGPRQTQVLIGPAVVNFCFSLELFCKALIALSGSKPPRGHLLEQLFAAIPEADRLAIATQYSETVIEPSMDELLKLVSNYFQQIRYDYEIPSEVVYWDFPIATLAEAAYVHVSRFLASTPASPRIQETPQALGK